MPGLYIPILFSVYILMFSSNGSFGSHYFQQCPRTDNFERKVVFASDNLEELTADNLEEVTETTPSSIPIKFEKKRTKVSIFVNELRPSDWNFFSQNPQLGLLNRNHILKCRKHGFRINRHMIPMSRYFKLVCQNGTNFQRIANLICAVH